MEISLKSFPTLAEADKCNCSENTTKTLAEGRGQGSGPAEGDEDF